MFLAAIVGISFVYINASFGHVTATSTAIFVFGGIAIVFGIILARVIGLINVKLPQLTKKEGESHAE
jgi:hypothetical protein